MREASIATSRLASLVNIAGLRIKWSAWLALWTNCYSYATILAPAFITAPMYFRGEIEFGTISQVCHTHLFSVLTATFVHLTACGSSCRISVAWLVCQGKDHLCLFTEALVSSLPPATYQLTVVHTHSAQQLTQATLAALCILA